MKTSVVETNLHIMQMKTLKYRLDIGSIPILVTQPSNQLIISMDT
jgi:hypothetical protein